MILSFKTKETEQVFEGRRVKGLPPEILKRAKIKLLLIHTAESLEDLKVPPGNRLEKLSGDREGQHSIRINIQWRICFRWIDQNALDVEITDYH